MQQPIPLPNMRILRIQQGPQDFPTDPPPCTYCPADQKRLPYRMLQAHHQVSADTVRVDEVWICHACEIRLWDIVLGRHGNDSFADHVSFLEEQLADVRQQLALLRTGGARS